MVSRTFYIGLAYFLYWSRVLSILVSCTFFIGLAYFLYWSLVLSLLVSHTFYIGLVYFLYWSRVLPILVSRFHPNTVPLKTSHFLPILNCIKFCEILIFPYRNKICQSYHKYFMNFKECKFWFWRIHISFYYLNTPLLLDYH